MLTHELLKHQDELVEPERKSSLIHDLFSLNRKKDVVFVGLKPTLHFLKIALKAYQ